MHEYRVTRRHETLGRQDGQRLRVGRPQLRRGFQQLLPQQAAHALAEPAQGLPRTRERAAAQPW